MERTTLETLLAVIVGIILGTVVVVSFWFVKTGRVNINLIQPLTKTTTVSTPTVLVTQKTVPFSLEISQPENGAVVQNQKIIVSGKTGANAQVLISDSTSDLVINADKDGIFQTNWTLDSGDNEIIITSLSQNGETQQQSLMVVYEKK